LKGDHNRLDDQYSRKRQRVEGAPTSQNGSSRSPIDIDEESTGSNRQIGPPASKSGSSQGMKGLQYQGVEEYNRVEDTVGFRKRKSNFSSSQSSSGLGGGSKYVRTSSGDQVVRLDDVHDPIEDDAIVTGVRHIKGNTSQPVRKSNLEVQILTPRQAESITGYQGTSHREPSRSKGKIWGNGTARQAPEEDKMSKYFPTAQKNQQRRISSGSHSADDTAPSRTSARLSDQQNGIPSNKRAASRNPSPPLNPDVSIDELNADEFHRHTAGTLLAKQKTAKGADSKSKGADKRSQSITLDESSDDDLSNDKANMITTDFTPSSKAKPKKQPGEATFVVLQVFSKPHKWLLASSGKRWSLHENSKQGILTIFDENGIAVPDLVLVPMSISRIAQCKDNSKVVLSKASDQTAKRAAQIYLEFSDREEREFFVQRMKEADSTIGVASQSG
jgi:hypothetical protein